MSNFASASQLISGFNKLEDNQWRWTDRTFVVALAPARGSKLIGAILRLPIFVPEAQIVPIRFEFDKVVAINTGTNYPLALLGGPLLQDYMEGSPAEAHGQVSARGAVTTEILWK